MKLRSIQVLRAAAACAVVVLHSFGEARGATQTSAVQLGAAGVDLFFVISGFIIATIGRRREPLAFLRDRAWRIYPLWLLAMAPWFLSYARDWPTILSSLTLWPVYDAFTFPALYLGWSLAFEMVFYAAFALALWTRPAVPLVIFGACFALSFTMGGAFFGFLGGPMVLEFLIGVWIARLPRNATLAFPLIVLGLIAFALSPIGLSHRDTAIVPELAIYRVALWGLPSAALVYGFLCLEGRFGSRAFDLPVFLGDASYSIYLFHLTALRLLQAHWLVEIVLAVGAGVVAHLLIERRLLRLKLAFDLKARGVLADGEHGFAARAP